MKRPGIGDENATAEATMAAVPVAAGSESETTVCGAGCSRGLPSSGRSREAVVLLIVALVIVGILSRRPSRKPWNFEPVMDGTVFLVTDAAPPARSGVGDRSARETRENETGEMTFPDNKPTNTTAAVPARTSRTIGEDLESLSALNKAASNRGAVFILIPAQASQMADDQTSAAVHAAQQTLNRSNITLGVYTLRANSSDYGRISAHVQLPVVLVASRGRGVAAVTGEVTETKLLQAFMAAARAGGCGASSCGPSGWR